VPVVKVDTLRTLIFHRKDAKARRKGKEIEITLYFYFLCVFASPLMHFKHRRSGGAELINHEGAWIERITDRNEASVISFRLCG
jgi:hypothetical protein